MKLTKELMEKLSQPFDSGLIQWKPQVTNKEKTKGLAVAYVDVRAYQDRLNELVEGDWSDNLELLNGGTIAISRLTIYGVTRVDVGEASKEDQNTVTSAVAQAFKRACVKFGLGAYLYKLPKAWVAYDRDRKTFTDAALEQLAHMLNGGKAPEGTEVAEPEIRPAEGKEAQPPPVVRTVLRQRGCWKPSGGAYVRDDETGQPITEQTKNAVIKTIGKALEFENCTPQDIQDNAKALLRWAFTVNGTDELSEQEGQAILYAWSDGKGGLHKFAKAEANACLAEAVKKETK